MLGKQTAKSNKFTLILKFYFQTIEAMSSSRDFAVKMINISSAYRRVVALPATLKRSARIVS